MRSGVGAVAATDGDGDGVGAPPCAWYFVLGDTFLVYLRLLIDTVMGHLKLFGVNPVVMIKSRVMPPTD